jgi:phosphatidylserine/phosphatidylglycerophosphate/cardiolipin synthase-like enzyme
MSSYLEEQSIRRRRVRKRWILGLLLAWWAGLGTWHTVKPMPPGTDVRTTPVSVVSQDVQFLYDLTRAGVDGKPIYEQRIFDEVFRIIDEAKSFIVADFFLVNDLMGSSTQAHRQLSREIVDHLIARKKLNPELTVLFITDPINDVYGGMQSPLLDAMRRAGIEVVITDLRPLRDSNPLYSPWWRTFVQWWGNSTEDGSMPNAFTPDAAPITLRSWLALLNFKANHRKLIIADRSDDALVALVTSANPHDASSAHSNVALRFRGSLAQELIESELALARFSGWRGHVYANPTDTASAPIAESEPRLSFLTEEAIRDHLLEHIRTARNGDSISIATFYLSDREVISHLLDAADRNVSVQLILDPNRDAFGRQKDGVPNRPVATELVTKSEGKIQVRWYRTHGEQFHTKLALITQGERLIASLGSANLTRRNLANYNLEANLAVAIPVDAPLAREMQRYFDRLWNNEGPPGAEFTAPFGAFEDKNRGRYWRYRIMEATGLSTF